ncbi:choice-of-anchor Q domain-containing protein, partial [Pseudomonadota bacterium]
NPNNIDRLSKVPSRGFGSTAPHSTHTESWITNGPDWGGVMPASAGADDKRGPGIYCSVCHDIDNMPRFRSGEDLDGDGLINLAETDVCNDCHSPNGTYNGVNTTNGSVGAKDNWNSGGVYDGDNKLKPGKEKWCAGCHDEDPSVIDYSHYAVDPAVVTISGDRAASRTVESATSNWFYGAPRVIGNESGAYTDVAVSPESQPDVTYPNFEPGNYTEGWGFYVTGHGAPADKELPGSGGLKKGPGRNCPDCHETEAPHIDGLHRTFVCPPGSSGGSCDADYKAGYRLIQPIALPRSAGEVDTQFDLCFSCHTDIGPWDDPGNTQTNFRSGGYQLHNYHLEVAGGGRYWWPDWQNAPSGTNMMFSCIQCHNPHGSRQLSMTRTGELAIFDNKQPRRPMRFWYKNANDPDWYWSNPGLSLSSKPSITNTTLAESTHLVMWSDDPIASGAKYCSQHCHGNAKIVSIGRSPATLPSGNIDAMVPELKWSGVNHFEADGVYPDVGVRGDKFLFRVKYTDANDEGPPSVIQLWIDLNDNGSYEANEKIDMQMAVAEINDTIPYFLGVDYKTTLQIDKPDGSDGVINYRFYALHGADAAIGGPTVDSTFSLLDNIATLSWTGEPGYESDGINPDHGAKSGNYTFRVKYTHDDGKCPTSSTDNIRLFIDLNLNGAYEAEEKFPLNEVSGGDGDCTTAGDGKLYGISKILPNPANNAVSYNYRFYAYDGVKDAEGAPVTEGGSVTVTGSFNNPPLLAWNPKTCQPQGAEPPRAAINRPMWFRVNYFDDDNQCPLGGSSNIQVWVDLDNSGGYSLNEKFNLDATDADGNCTVAGGGKLYQKQITSTAIGSDIRYEFYATDGIDAAYGEPVEAGSTIEIVNASYAVTQDGSHDGVYSFDSITSALSVVGSQQGKTILVHAGTYPEKLYITQDQTTIASACGAEETIVQHSNNPVVYFYRAVNTMLDGFTVTGGSGRGVFNKSTNYAGNSSPIIRSSIIRGNTGVGIYNEWGTMTVSDSEISNNSDGGAYMFGGSTFADTIIKNNSTSGNGGGIFLKSAATLTDVTITDNTATKGGGISCETDQSYRVLDVDRAVISGNRATSSGGGIFVAKCDPTFTNVLLSDNNAPQGGGAAFVAWGKAWFENSTIVNNAATAGNGGAFYSSDGPAQLANSIAWGNRASGTGHIGAFVASGVKTVNIYSSIIENNGDNDIKDDGYFHTSSTVTIVDAAMNSDRDPNFVNAANRDYRLQHRSSAIDSAGNESGRGIPAVDLLGYDRLSDSQDIGAYEYQPPIVDVAPVLAWTGETDFVEDGVSPDRAAGGTYFEFRVDYYHAENVAPAQIELWIDENGDGAYQQTEKHAMNKITGSDFGFADNNYINGERYTKQLRLSYPGSGEMNYRFFASDGKRLAVDAPTVTSTVAVGNTAPVLEWLGTGEYASHGVSPVNGNTGDSFTFKVRYKDVDGQAPVVKQVWIDENDDHQYVPSERYELVKVGAGTDYVNGEVYTVTRTLTTAGDDRFRYRFYFTDGSDVALGAPTNVDRAKARYSRYVVASSVPVLNWTGEAGFMADGVEPNSALNSAAFEFRVTYVDPVNRAPDPIQVWVDANDDGGYSYSEKHNLQAVDASDTNYVDGKIYSKTMMLTAVGDGHFSYRFYALNYVTGATGAPIDGGSITLNFTKDVSGVVYTDQGITPIGDGSVVRLVINGLTAGTGTTTNGAYNIPAVYSEGDHIIACIDGNILNGRSARVSDGEPLSDFNIYGGAWPITWECIKYSRY